jgi:hypothetical protein
MQATKQLTLSFSFVDVGLLGPWRGVSCYIIRAFIGILALAEAGAPSLNIAPAFRHPAPPRLRPVRQRWRSLISGGWGSSGSPAYPAEQRWHCLGNDPKKPLFQPKFFLGVSHGALQHLALPIPHEEVGQDKEESRQTVSHFNLLVLKPRDLG